MQCAVRRLARAGLLLAMFATACATSGSAPQARTGHTAVLDQAGGRMLVFGGHSHQNSLHAYNISGDSWSLLWPGGNWPSARSGHTAVLHESGGRMLVFGGLYTGPVSNLHAYDLVSNSWSELLPTGPQPSFRHDHTAILDESGGRMLVYGGSDGSLESLVSNNYFVYAYNLSDDSWSYHVPHDFWESEVSAPNDRWQHTAVLDKAGGRMLVFAGYGDTQGGYRRRRRLFSSHFGDLKDLWAFDLASNSWAELASHWASFGNHAAVLDEAGGRMLVSGGTSTTGNWVSAYDLAGNRWSEVWASATGSGSAPLAFRSFSAVLEQGCGQMFVYGGEGVEITVFHTASNSWSSPTACTSTSTTTTVSWTAPATVTMSSSTTLTSSSTSSATFTSTSTTSATLTATSLTPSATTSTSSVTTTLTPPASFLATLTSTSTTSATFTTASLTSSTATVVTSSSTTSTLSPTSTTSETFTTTASLTSSITSVTSSSTMSTFSSTSTTSATFATTSLTSSTTASTTLSTLSTLSSTSTASTTTSATTNSQTTTTGTRTTTTLTAGTRTTTLTAGTLSLTTTTSASSSTTFTSSASTESASSTSTATTTTSSSLEARGVEGGGGGLPVAAVATAATGGALALLVLGTIAALKSRWPCHPTDLGGNRPDPGVLAEKTFRGKAGRGPAVVVSCPGAEDEDIGFGKGEVFAMVTAMQDLAVSVVFVEAAHIAEFWPLYLRALHEYATDKKYIVVLTKQNGGIGNVQRQEVTFLAGCDGRTVPGAEPRPNFRKGDVHVMAMTFRQLVAWQRLGFNETALGKAVPAAVRNKFVKELPSLAEMEEKFARLVADAE